MTIEAATYVNQLDQTRPLAADLISEGDDHERLVKATLKNSFPNIGGAMNATHTELNYVVGVTSPIQSQLNGVLLSNGKYSETWVAPVASGVFSYLPTTAVQKANTLSGGSCFFGATRSSVGAGSANEAYLGHSVFGYNDKVGGSAGVWGHYSTMVRVAGVLGPTHGMEVDIANLGTTVPITPQTIVAAGQTNGLWIATGGEATANTSVGSASCAIGILRNDVNASPTATFDKGIVFHNKAISGANGTTGTGIAIALGRGHLLQWYSAGDQGIGYWANQVNTANLATNVSIDDTGFSLLGGSSQGMLQVAAALNTVNYVQIKAGLTTVGPTIKAIGEANTDLILQANGTGSVTTPYVLKLTNPSALQATASNCGFEIGALGTANSPYIDFHSSSTNNDYDARIIASSGGASSGQGTLTVTAAGFVVNAGFGANGNAAQLKATVPAASTDLASVISLANSIRTALINNGICQ